ncbi:1-phosphatidylinositol phosphodiesterase [Pseudomonas sp. ok272]|uniref:phospholipase n=1 Tax=unclassified Pseudomonas TaxID=196821 RepID=UPI0008C1A373|nr:MULTISPECIES: phospholipase [unclassified Pseudomonas]SEM46785.1 1-phosphatidylinositol phosphodiesterase [Pseudomonas sp. ok272]SFM18418.1 1-phosphatidylinositol phosphodiesterase [Pseudomonas sp. ok602]
MNKDPLRKQWMSATSSIDKLTLTELVWPGAHNAGIDFDVPFSPSIRLLANWFVCQNRPFIQQLNEGVRALDLRFHCDEHWLGIKKFHTFHGAKLFNGRSLSELIKSLTFFLDNNPDEFIILDIHELRGLDDKRFDYKGFHDVIMSELGERLIPERNSHFTLGELKKFSPRQRIVLAIEGHPDLYSATYWRKIKHAWSGKDIISPNELKQHIQDTLSYPSQKNVLWSLSATCYGELAGVKRITQELNEWFGPTSAWAPKCSIINADFITDTDLVDYCRQVNHSKGLLKS